MTLCSKNFETEAKNGKESLTLFYIDYPPMIFLKCQVAYKKLLLKKEILNLDTNWSSFITYSTKK